MGLKSKVPWQLKIALKMVLARIPLGSATWRKVGIFQQGSMHTGEYAWQIFEHHLAEYMTLGGLAGKTVLELGPGDGIATGLLASCFGAHRTILVDAGDRATQKVSDYKNMLSDWDCRGAELAHLVDCSSFEQLAQASNTTYLSNGLSSLKTIPSDSVDIEFSNAVLEHVRKSEFRETLNELRRILKSDGVSYHSVDLKDHLGGRLDNLRFSEGLWNSRLFSDSGFYTNRIRFRAMLGMFAEAGFHAEVRRTLRWDHLPTPRKKLNSRFSHLDDSDLLVSAFNVVLRKSGSQGIIRGVE